MADAPITVRIDRAWDEALLRTASSRPAYSAAVLLGWSQAPPPVDAGVPPAIVQAVSQAVASLGPVAFRLFFPQDLPPGLVRLPAPRAWLPLRLYRRLARSWPTDIAIARDAAGAAELFLQDWQLQGQAALVLAGGAMGGGSEGNVGMGEATLDRLRRARDWRKAGFPKEALLLIAPAVDGDGILLAAAGARQIDLAVGLLRDRLEQAGIAVQPGAPDAAPGGPGAGGPDRGAAAGMDIAVSHHVDASEPDAQGLYEYHYEYDIYRYSHAGRTYVARAYTDQPGQASFLSCLEGGNSRLLDSADLVHPLLVRAADHLRGLGKARLDRLTPAEGYVPLEIASPLMSS